MKTPEEIKRALECSVAQVDGRCEEYAACVCCPLFAENVGMEDIAAYIQQLEAQVSKWISVEERLPKNEEFVLIATKWSLMGMRGTAVSCAFHTDGKTFTGDSDFNWNDGNVDLIYDEEEDEYIVPEGWWEGVRYTEHFAAVDEPIIAWMPLPEPPKEEGV